MTPKPREVWQFVGNRFGTQCDFPVRVLKVDGEHADATAIAAHNALYSPGVCHVSELRLNAVRTGETGLKESPAATTAEEAAQARRDIIERLNTKGHVGISEDAREAILSIIEPVWEVLSEEFTGFRLTLRTKPRRMDWSKPVWDAESELMLKFGNEPYAFSTDFNSWRLTFTANR